MTHETKPRSVALLTVCLAQELEELALQAAADLDWSLTEATFDRYISARRRPHFGDKLRESDLSVALINFDLDPVEAAAAAGYLLQVFSGKITIVAVSRVSSPEVVLRAMQAGCSEFLTELCEEQDIRRIFHRVDENFVSRSLAPHTQGSLIALFGAKGGVGTTTLAVHLAFFLVKVFHKKVLLIDNHAQFGHACIYLGLDGSGVPFQELVQNVTRLDSELLQGFVAVHPSGLHVLSSPDVGYGVRAMHPEDVRTALEFLCTEYDLVIVDSDEALNDVNRSVIATATQVYVVATPEISALRDLSRSVDELVRLDDMTNKVKVVINRYSSQFAVSLEEIERAIRLPVSFSIPNSYIDLVRSANLGTPLDPALNAGFCIEVSKWAASLVGEVGRTLSSRPERGASRFWMVARDRLAAVLKHSSSAEEKRA